MANIYRTRDDVIEGAVNGAINRLKQGAGQPLPRGTDHSKPPLDYLPPSPSVIKPTREWPKKIRIDLPQ
jgi:hypothetical protein